MKILKEGVPAIIVSFCAGLALILFLRLVPFDLNLPLVCIFFAAGILFLLFGFFCLYFFRAPYVKSIDDTDIVLSPCTGTVMEIDDNRDEKVLRVFLSIFDVHLQRSPVHGTIKSVEHKNGKFLMAMRPEAHSVNEQNIITIENKTGIFVVRQIAGFIARRCIAQVKKGDNVKMGEKIGLIKFGSQVDLHVPAQVEITVRAGDKLKGGVTVVGKLR
jgi:phosphatidylserine decarboxylase